MTGACLGRSGFNRMTAYATLAMTLAAEAPDIDMLSYLGGPVAGFAHHRGITHTFIGAPFMALAVTGLVWCFDRWRRRRKRKPPVQPVRWFVIWLLALIADGSHLLLDYTNSYGLRPLFPFNPHWYAWSIMPIVSPVMLGLLAMGLLMPALLGLVESEMRRRQRGALHGRSWAVAALVGVALLYTLRAVEHDRAIDLVRQFGSGTAAPLVRVAAVPAMVDPFLWHTLAATPTSYQTVTAHMLHGTLDDLASIPKPPETPAVRAAEQTFLGRVYMDWSSWPVINDLGETPPPNFAQPLPPGSTTVEFRDLRFSPDALGLLISGGSSGPLSGYVVVTPDGGLVGQWMDGAEQR